MLKLTGHAQRRLEGRNISIEWVVAAIQWPDWTEADTDPLLTRSFRAIEPFGGRILRVVHRSEGDDILVITAYFDRNAT